MPRSAIQKTPFRTIGVTPETKALLKQVAEMEGRKIYITVDRLVRARHAELIAAARAQEQAA